MIKALLFDFNGVIIDDEPVQMEAYKEVFKEVDVDLTEEKYYACLGMNDEVFVRTIFEREGKEVSDEKLSELVEAKTANWQERIKDNIPIFEGVGDFVKRMANEFSIGLVSMARRPEIDYVLESTGLKDSFSVVVSAENIATTKPDPECYREGFRLIDLARAAEGKSSITRRQCVVIEDSPQGIVAGRGAGLKTLGITSTVDAEQLREAGANAVTTNLADWSPDSFRRVF